MILSRILSNFFFFSSRRRHTRLQGDWSSDVCSSDLVVCGQAEDHTAMYVAMNKIVPNLVRQEGEADPRTGEEIGRASCRERSVDLGGRRIIKKKKKK